jgi:HK97 family phage major capsid protein
MSDVAKRLTEQRANVWEQTKALADAAADESRSFTADEQSKWESLNTDLDALDQRIKTLVDGEQRAREAEAAMVALRGEPKASGPAPVADGLRAFLAGETRSYTATPGAGVSFRDLVKGTTTAGGYTVPTDFYGTLVEHLTENSAVLRAGVTVLNTDGGETLQIPKTTAHGSAAIVAEGGAIPENDPTFGQASLGAYKYGDLIQISRELVTDTGVDLVGYLAAQAGRALGNAFGAHLVSGTGSSQPRGILLDVSAGVTGAAVTPTADDLIDLFYSVIAPYRNSSACGWLMNDSTVATIRKLKDSNGVYMWQPSLTVGAPDSILGKPVHTDPNMPATGDAAESILFGDFSRYFVRMVNGIRFERSDDFAFNTDLVSYRALMRADGTMVDLTGAVKSFVGADVA